MAPCFPQINEPPSEYDIHFHHKFPASWRRHSTRTCQRVYTNLGSVWARCAEAICAAVSQAEPFKTITGARFAFVDLRQVDHRCQKRTRQLPSGERKGGNMSATAALRGIVFAVLLFLSSFVGILFFSSFLTPVWLIRPDLYRHVSDKLIAIWEFYIVVSRKFLSLTWTLSLLLYHHNLVISTTVGTSKKT